jgi:hypothetical protein
MEIIKFRHFFNREHSRTNGGITIAYKVVDKMLEIGIAFCGSRDQFSRKEGRRIALERLTTDPLVVDILYAGDKRMVHYTFINLIANLLYHEPNPWTYHNVPKNNPYWFASVPDNTVDWFSWRI